MKDGHADPHQVAADQIGSEGAQRDNGAGIEPEPEAPAQQGAEAGTDANGDDRDHGAAIINATAAAYSISKSFLSRREAADSAPARQGEATTTGMVWGWNYILLGSQVAICGKNQSSSTITHIRKKKGRVTRAM